MVSGIKIEKFKEESWDSLERKNDSHGELEPTCARREACLSAPFILGGLGESVGGGQRQEVGKRWRNESIQGQRADCDFLLFNSFL